ncbi:MAG: prenyltransferase/squalene oxidase repeat-containing protein [Candidatus Thermoplasmatota archaeon]
MDQKEIKDSINNAIDFLINNQNKDGSVSLNKDTRWDVWETANAYLSIYFANKNKEIFLKKSINFIAKSKRKDGSFCHNVSFKKGDYCMETTPLCLLTLYTKKKNIQSGLNFIFDKQKQNGSWEIGNPGIIKYKDWPSVTGFILYSFLHMDIKSDSLKKGIEFLLKKQQLDGSWGSHWVYYDTPYYPMHTILPVLKKIGKKNTSSFKKAINFIVKEQNVDGSWGKEVENRPSKNLRTALALNSLLNSEYPSVNIKIEKGINWLLENQKTNGSWSGGEFVGWPGKKEDIFTTATAIRALNKYNTLLRKKSILNIF